MTEETKRQIGQLFMMRVPDRDPDGEFERFCKRYRIGNYALSAQNCYSLPELCELVSRLRRITDEATGEYPLIGIDQEGGWVSRLYEGAALISGAMSYAAMGADREKMIDVGQKLGRILRATGANMDFAPVLDVNIEPQNPIVGTRAYGDDPERVAELGVGFALGLESVGVLTSVKHFPGHGNVATDTHLGVANNACDRETLRKTEFLPFRRAFDAGIGGAMVSHVTFDAYDEDTPSVLSREITTELLRREMGFEGIAITDSMGMKAVNNERYPRGEAAVRAILAGCDILLYYASHGSELVEEAILAVYAAVESGRIPLSRIEESYERVIRQKKTYRIADCEPDYELAKSLTEDEAARAEVLADKCRSITCMKKSALLGELEGKRLLCLSPMCDAVRGVEEKNKIPLSFADMAREAFAGATSCVSATSGMTAEVERALEGDYDAAIFGVFNGRMKPSQFEILDALRAKGLPVIAVLLNSPYDFRFVEDCEAVLCAYEYTTLSMKALIRCMKIGVYEGILPVKL